MVVQPVAGRTEGGQVVGLVGPTIGAGVSVVHLEESSSPASGSLATVLVTGEDLPANARGNGGFVATTPGADGGIAFQAFGIGPAQLAFS